MKLILTKNQSKGLLGGVKFEVRAQVELSEEEKKLIHNYKLENDILFQKKMVSIWGHPTDYMLDVKVKDFLSGQTYKCKDLSEVISFAESLKEAGKTLKAYLEVAKSFGGQEVIEY
ncbi:MAG: hypothetical protein ABIL39_07180 [candidate division WOR-3 bacterium]